MNRLWFYGFLFFTGIVSARAQKDSMPQQELEAVTVYYNRWERQVNEVPNRIAKINLKQLRLQNPQTMADALNASGEVFIQKSQMGGGSPMIRGFATNRVLMVVDGVRMNNAIYRSGNIQNVISFDPLALEDAEVIFGPGSLMYGSDAIGGVMDFHTLSPKLANKGTLVQGSAFARYASANGERTIHADANLGGEKLSWLVSFTNSRFGDLRMGRFGGPDSYLRRQYVERINGVDQVINNGDPLLQKQSGYTQQNFMTKLRWKPSTSWDIEYGFHYSGTGNVPRYDRLIEYAGTNLRFAEWYYGPQLWKMHNLQIRHRQTKGLYNDARLIIARQDYEESRNDRRRGNNSLRNQTENVGAWSVNLDFTKTFGEKAELYYGAEWVDNQVGSFARNINIASSAVAPTATRYPNGSSWNSLAAYVSYRTELHSRLNFTSGLRYNHNSIQANFDTSFFKFPFTRTSLNKGSLTGNAGVVYKASNRWQFSLLASSGFRMPNIDDIGKVFESAPGIVVVPNPSLQSEYAWNLELGTRYEVDQQFNAFANVFYTLLDNALSRRAFQFNGQDSIVFDGIKSRVEAIQNVAQARVWGVQLGWEWMLHKNLRWQARLNWIKGKETDDTKDIQVPLRHAPPFYGSMALQFQHNKWLIELNAQYNSEISNTNLAPSEQAKPAIYATDANGKPYCPAWYTLNLKAGYQVSEKITANIGWENMTDQRYRPYSSGIVAPGSNVLLSVRVQF